MPYRLPDHDEKTVWKSKTSPRSDDDNAFNEIRLDDSAGNELVFVQAQKDFVQITKRNETERTGDNRATVVGRRRTAVVADTDVTLVGTKYSIQIVEPPDRDKSEVKDKTELKIIAELKPDLTPLPTKLEMVAGQVLATSGKASFVLRGDDIVFVAKNELSIRAKGSVTISGGPDIKINC